ncbi:hypothetical protein Tco_0017583 [Tanacetum coccineum]
MTKDALVRRSMIGGGSGSGWEWWRWYLGKGDEYDVSGDGEGDGKARSLSTSSSDGNGAPPPPPNPRPVLYLVNQHRSRWTPSSPHPKTPLHPPSSTSRPEAVNQLDPPQDHHPAPRLPPLD